MSFPVAGGVFGASKATAGGLGHGASFGLSFATRGTLNFVPFTMPSELESDINTGTVDENGNQVLLSNTIRDIRFADVNRSTFWHPDRSFTGYAANGFWYTDGRQDPTHVPFKASWAEEGESGNSHRGLRDAFPERIFIITTEREVAIVDADRITLWMRFIRISGAATQPHGAFLGDEATDLRSADFLNGYLVVATDEGIRIADFRRDVGYILLQTGSKVSGSGLVDRVVDGYLDGSALPSSANVSNIESFSVSMALRTNHPIDGGTGNKTGDQDRFTAVAVGMLDGIAGITLKSPSTDVPSSLNHVFLQTRPVAWHPVDDSDGDSTSPIFTDATSLSGNVNVRPGDVIVTDLGVEYTILEVDSDTYTVEPEILLSLSGSAYVIRRTAGVVVVTGETKLYFASGDQKITSVPDEEWFEGGLAFDGFTEPALHQSSFINIDAGGIRDLAVGAGGVYAATGVGVFFVTDDNLEEGRDAEHFYGADDLVDLTPTYLILEGSISDCTAVEVDPETGHVAVVATSGGVSVVTEIDTTIQRAFRFFDGNTLQGEVQSLVTYRNINGPPDNLVGAG